MEATHTLGGADPQQIINFWDQLVLAMNSSEHRPATVCKTFDSRHERIYMEGSTCEMLLDAVP